MINVFSVVEKGQVFNDHMQRGWETHQIGRGPKIIFELLLHIRCPVNIYIDVGRVSKAYFKIPSLRNLLPSNVFQQQLAKGDSTHQK